MILYFFVAILATAVGALTGMGGGVIIKPVMDVLGHYDVATIGVLSSVTVFSMSLVSIGRQLLRRIPIPLIPTLPLALGSVAGGLIGQSVLEWLIGGGNSGQGVTVIQNTVLALLILLVFAYMKKRRRIRGLCLKGGGSALLAGVFLGMISSFLGIGGGPINVALIMFLFSLDIKAAAVCSLVAILFAQVSKLASVAAAAGLGAYDLTVLPAMVTGAVAGGLIGSRLSHSLKEKTVETCFNGVQLLVLAIAVFNIVRNAGG